MNSVLNDDTTNHSTCDTIFIKEMDSKRLIHVLFVNEQYHNALTMPL